VVKPLTSLLNNIFGEKLIGLWSALYVDARSRIDMPMMMHKIGRSISHAMPNVSRTYYLNLLMMSA